MNNTRPAVSLVTPSLNQAQFLGEALESVMSQDFEHLELIVADGGSTDGSLRLLQSVADSDLRMRFFSEKDSGPADAVNKAIQRTSGAIIGWVNADDRLTDGAVKSIVEAFEKNPDLVMIYGQGEWIDGSGASKGLYPTLPPDAGIEAFHNGCYICQPTAFFRREVLDRVGFLDTTLKASFDFDLWLRIFSAFPGKIGFLDTVLAQSRIHNATITSTQRRTVAIEGIRILKKHLGSAKPEWAISYFQETLEAAASDPQARDFRSCFLDFLAEVQDDLSGENLEKLRNFLSNHPPISWAERGLYLSVSCDLWAGFLCRLDFQQQIPAVQSLRIFLQIPAELTNPIRLLIYLESPLPTEILLEPGRTVEITIPCTDLLPGMRRYAHFLTSDRFQPAVIDKSSNDFRQLTYQITHCDFVVERSE